MRMRDFRRPVPGRGAGGGRLRERSADRTRTAVRVAGVRVRVRRVASARVGGVQNMCKLNFRPRG
eukprot:697711-Prymnesium_polylepis.1